MHGTDDYDLLGVSRDVDLEHLKEVYRQRAKELHPDITQDSSHHGFVRLTAAYHAVYDARQREITEQMLRPIAWQRRGLEQNEPPRQKYVAAPRQAQGSGGALPAVVAFAAILYAPAAGGPEPPWQGVQRVPLPQQAAAMPTDAKSPAPLPSEAVTPPDIAPAASLVTVSAPAAHPETVVSRAPHQEIVGGAAPKPKPVEAPAAAPETKRAETHVPVASFVAHAAAGPAAPQRLRWLARPVVHAAPPRLAPRIRSVALSPVRRREDVVRPHLARRTRAEQAEVAQSTVVTETPVAAPAARPLLPSPLQQPLNILRNILRLR